MEEAGKQRRKAPKSALEKYTDAKNKFTHITRQRREPKREGGGEEGSGQGGKERGLGSAWILSIRLTWASSREGPSALWDRLRIYIYRGNSRRVPRLASTWVVITLFELEKKSCRLRERKGRKKKRRDASRPTFSRRSEISASYISYIGCSHEKGKIALSLSLSATRPERRTISHRRTQAIKRKTLRRPRFETHSLR